MRTAGDALALHFEASHLFFKQRDVTPIAEVNDFTVRLDGDDLFRRVREHDSVRHSAEGAEGFLGGGGVPLGAEANLEHFLARILLDEFSWATFGHDSAFVHHHEPVAELLGLVHVVGRDHDGQPLGGQGVDLVPELAPRLGVDAGGLGKQPGRDVIGATGGTAMTLFLNSGEADNLLYQLGAQEKVAQQSDVIYRRSIEKQQYAQSVTDELGVAKKELAGKAAVAKAAFVEAQNAANAVQSKVDENNRLNKTFYS